MRTIVASILLSGFCGAITGCDTGPGAAPVLPADAAVAVQEDFLDASSPVDATTSPPIDAAVVDAPVDAGIDAYIDLDAGPATFTQVYDLIIHGPPACYGCHTGGASADGRLDMSTQTLAYMHLVNQPATTAPACASETIKLVDPGSASTSLMYLKVTAPPCGSEMPLGGPYLSTEQTDVIASWINAGALNN